MSENTATAVAEPETTSAPTPPPPPEPTPTPEPAPTPAPEPAPAPPPQPTGPQSKFSKAKVYALFVTGLGFPTAMGWSPARMAKNIERLPENEKETRVAGRVHLLDYVEKLDPKNKFLYDQLKYAVENKLPIELEGEKHGEGEPAPAGESKKKGGKAKKGGGGKKAKGTTPAKKKSSVERDAFGSAKGTRGHDAMKVLMKQEDGVYLKVNDIASKSGHDPEKEFVGVFYNFLNDQVKKGNVKKNDKGYAVTAAGRKKAEKAAEEPKA